jgi:hypothetical protein
MLFVLSICDLLRCVPLTGTDIQPMVVWNPVGLSVRNTSAACKRASHYIILPLQHNTQMETCPSQ